MTKRTKRITRSDLPTAVVALALAGAALTAGAFADHSDVATRSTGQAAADGRARAHTAAGAALAPFAAAGDGLPNATAGALTATATVYATLASAAGASIPQPYADARRAVTSADANLRHAMTKIAAAASATNRTATSRTATQAASTPVPKPAARTKATAANPKAEATNVKATSSKPAASARNGIDLSIPLLSLLGVFAILIAVRQTRRLLP